MTPSCSIWKQREILVSGRGQNHRIWVRIAPGRCRFRVHTPWAQRTPAAQAPDRWAGDALSCSVTRGLLPKEPNEPPETAFTTRITFPLGPASSHYFLIFFFFFFNPSPQSTHDRREILSGCLLSLTMAHHFYHNLRSPFNLLRAFRIKH